MKVPLIIWSGGVDSTYLVWDAISKDKTIETLYIDLANNSSKVKREKAARKKMMKKFKEYNGNIRKDHLVKFPVLHVNQSTSLVQPLMWFTAVNLTFDPEKHSHVEFGYIRGDDFWHVKHDILQSYKHMNQVVRTGTEINIKFPLEWMTKVDVLEGYQDNDFGKELLEMTTICEHALDLDKGSCRCTPCIHRETAEFELKLRQN